MNKLKKALAIFSLMGAITPVATAQNGFADRLPSLVQRGRVLVTELSARQQESFGFSAVRERLASAIDANRTNRVNRLAGSIAAAELGISLTDDLDRAGFIAVRRGQSPSFRLTALLNSAQEQFGSEFDEAVVEIIAEASAEPEAPEEPEVPEPTLPPVPDTERPTEEVPPETDGPGIFVGVVTGRPISEVAAETGLTPSIVSLLGTIERNGSHPRTIEVLNIRLDAQSPELRAQSVAAIQSLFPDLVF